MSSVTPASSTVDFAGGSTINAVHSDIIRAHILTRLDGQSLVSTSCASPHFRSLSDDEKLWTKLCNSSWPSTVDSRVRAAVSSFPSGHRSFFSDAFTSLHHVETTSSFVFPSETSELISAVDIRFGNEVVYSKAVSTETTSGWFLGAPFRIDLLDPKETVPTGMKFESGDQDFVSEVAKTMSLSWILIDARRKRAVNLSSLHPVMVQRHWLTDDIVARYATIISGDCSSGSPELVLCKLEITCQGKVGGLLKIKEVNMQLDDMEGKALNGKDSLIVLQGAMDGERRKRKKEERERYEEYEVLKRERRVRKQRRERRQDSLCIGIGVTIFVVIWAISLFR